MLPVIIVSLSLLLGVSGQQACDLQTFAMCQQKFASALQIPSQVSADWHNPTALALALQQIFANGLPGWSNALVGVCNAYNGLITCLGPMATTCLDPLFLLSNDNTPDNAYGYISIIKGLGFDCGAGFYPGVYNWDCISRVYSNYNATLYDCVRTFALNFLHDPDNACDYLQQALNCISGPYKALCPASGVWFGCETWRTYFTVRLYTCPAQCSLGQFKAEKAALEQHPETKDVQLQQA